jgi:hypothetical protein
MPIQEAHQKESLSSEWSYKGKHASRCLFEEHQTCHDFLYHDFSRRMGSHGCCFEKPGVRSCDSKQAQTCVQDRPHRSISFVDDKRSRVEGNRISLIVPYFQKCITFYFSSHLRGTVQSASCHKFRDQTHSRQDWHRVF